MTALVGVHGVGERSSATLYGARVLAAYRGFVEPERLRRDLGLLSEQRDAFDHVAQLANVPGPAIAEKSRAGVGREGLRWQAVLGAGAGQEVVGQEQNILAALAERRHPERQHREPVVEVLPEPPCPCGAREVLVSGSDDPHVDRFAPRAPEPPHGPLLDHLQQLGLEHAERTDRKSTRLNSSHLVISYA